MLEMASVLVEEKMKQNSFLVTVTSDDILNLKVKNLNFLFPITNYSVGFLHTFFIQEIHVPNAFLYCNRIFDNQGIQDLEKNLKDLPDNIKGICFTDLGVLHLVKRLNLNLELIYMQIHSTTNVESINYYLEDVDSVLVSTDITKEEMDIILDNAKKPLVVPYFMLVDVMYSRRNLLKNFQEEFSLKKQNNVIIEEPISKESFQLVENDLGTVIYHHAYIDYRHIDHENIKYYFINPLGLSLEDVKKVINGEDVSSLTHHGFLDKETYYRLEENR